MDELRREIDDIVKEEEADLLVLRRDLADQDRRMAAIQVAGLALGLLGGLGGALMFASGVVRGVRRLEANAALLAAGEPLAALPPGRDEVAGLGRAMDAAASRLRQAQDLLKGVIDGTPDVVYVKDLQRRYLLMNRAGATYLDRDLDDIVGRTDEESVPRGPGRHDQGRRPSRDRDRGNRGLRVHGPVGRRPPLLPDHEGALPGRIGRCRRVPELD